MAEGPPRDLARCGRGERIADAAVRVMSWASTPPGCWQCSAGCSALYNTAGVGRRKALLCRLNHSAIFAGGLLHSLGVVVHLSTRPRYHDALWHAPVVAAAACHCAVVLRLAQTAG